MSSSKRRRCRDCWHVWPHDDEYVAMSRLYVKRKQGGKWRWIAVGWICPSCLRVEVDKVKFKEFRYPVRRRPSVQPQQPVQQPQPAQTAQTAQTAHVSSREPVHRRTSQSLCAVCVCRGARGPARSPSPLVKL